MAGSLVAPQSEQFTLLGLITTDKPATSIRVVLQDPRERNAL